jgi:hypothetical protein
VSLHRRRPCSSRVRSRVAWTSNLRRPQRR